ncbi:DUF397 domain-containing protein [Nocardia fusca]|uniref:DUF397 domain-containing protein n=1 Tax=Nocardia fusca TaxID=941183 RepID=UPI0007A74F2F|nr:DUF397 domain-containing protein [Nocardia fusca]
MSSRRTAQPAISTGWLKSYSGGSQDCVEVAFFEGGVVGVPGSKDRGGGPALSFTSGAWDTFTSNIRTGRLDRP